MHREEHAGLAPAVAERGQHLHGVALDDVDLHVLAVGQVDPALLGIVRKVDVPRRALRAGVRRHDVLGDERAVLLEDLDAVFRPVADVDEAVVGDHRAMHGAAELRGGLAAGLVAAEVEAVVGLVAVGAPEPLDLAVVHVDDRDAAVEVAVGEVGLVGLVVDADLGDPAEAVGGVAVALRGGLARALADGTGHAGAGNADLHQEVALMVELHHVRVGAAVAADPDVVHAVHGDPVVRHGPHVVTRLGAGAAPALQEVPLLVELEDRWSGLAALGDRRVGGHADLGVQDELVGRVAVHDPDVVVGVDVHPDGRPHQPVVRQVLGKQRIDLERRHAVVRVHRERGAPAPLLLGAGGGHHDQRRRRQRACE